MPLSQFGRSVSLHLKVYEMHKLLVPIAGCLVVAKLTDPTPYEDESAEILVAAEVSYKVSTVGSVSKCLILEKASS